ncbi:MAG: hypothetical protein FWD69_01180 [Polyangiaceae bacterium]|nr:hypothetical protein [Polyangiaceae bacterium]
MISSRSEHPDVVPPELGEALSRCYELEHALMRTDATVVFEARDRRSGNSVAIEVITLPDAESRTRAQHDAALARRLEGSHVLRVIDAGALPNGSPFVVRELCLTTLADEVHRRGAMAIEQAVAWTLESCEAVAEAHSLGMFRGAIDAYHVYLTHSPHETPSVKLAWQSKDSNLTSADMDPDIARLGELLLVLVTGELEVRNLKVASTLPSGLAHAILRATRPQDNESFRNVADFAEALVPFGPLGHPSARNAAFLLARGGLLPASSRTHEPRPAPPPVTSSLTETTSSSHAPVTRRVLRGSAVALVSAAAIGATLGAALLLAGTDRTRDAKTKSAELVGVATIASGVVPPTPTPARQPETDATADAPPGTGQALPSAREAKIGRFEITVDASAEEPADDRAP